jgi:hypothetical protein
MKTALIILSATVILFSAAGQAQALPGVKIAPGVGLGSNAEQAYGSDTALLGEIGAYMSLGILKLDLSLMAPLKEMSKLQIRPGVRVMVPLVYLRGAIPISFEDGPGYGFLLGLGKQFSIAPAVALFVELDGTWFSELDDSLSFEGYAGLEIGF